MVDLVLQECNMPKRIAGGSDEWETPKELFDKLNKQYGFNIDLCSTESNKKCEIGIQHLQDLNLTEGIGWINPPFSKAYEMFNIALKLPFPVVGIYRCDNLESKVWQDIIFKCVDWIIFFRGRTKYEDPFGNRTSPMFPSAIFGKGISPPRGLDGVLIIPPPF